MSLLYVTQIHYRHRTGLTLKRKYAVRYKFPKSCRSSQYVGVWAFRILLVSLLLFACCLQTCSVDLYSFRPSRQERWIHLRKGITNRAGSVTTSDWVIIEWRLADKSLKWASNNVGEGFHYVSYSQSSVFERDEVFSLYNKCGVISDLVSNSEPLEWGSNILSRDQ